MTTGMLQDSLPPPGLGPRFCPFASPDHQVTKARYITSNDPRGYIPVYEYLLKDQWIMMDIDDGYILWTGIWKALGNSKADIVKMVDSQPDLANVLRRVRGGYLKIQGTWMPYEVALRLSRRVAWPIRNDLIPLFGPTFPSTCLAPDQPGYGQVVASGSARRRPRRPPHTAPAAPAAPPRAPAPWTVVTPAAPLPPPGGARLPLPLPHAHFPGPSGAGAGAGPSAPAAYARYSPYPPRAPHPPSPPPAPRITLPPLHAPAHAPRAAAAYALPPISALEDLRGLHTHDAAAVLQRLKLVDEPAPAAAPSEAARWARRRSLSTPPYTIPPAHADPPARIAAAHSLPEPATPRDWSSAPRSPSTASADGSGGAPRSPLTPRSAGDRDRDRERERAPSLVPLAVLKEHGRAAAPWGGFPGAPRAWAPGGARARGSSDGGSERGGARGVRPW